MAAVTETVQIAARVPADLADRLAVLAEKAERSVSAELRVALRSYVEKAEREAA